MAMEQAHAGIIEIEFVAGMSYSIPTSYPKPLSSRGNSFKSIDIASRYFAI